MTIKRERRPIVLALVQILNSVVEANEANNVTFERSIFDCRNGARMSLEEYLDQIDRNLTHCSPECYVIAMYYMDSLAIKNEHWQVTSRNVHKLFLTSLVLAIKYHEDIIYKNKHYARIGGISTKKLNQLELELLRRLDFNLHVDVDVFELYQAQLNMWIKTLDLHDETEQEEQQQQQHHHKKIQQQHQQCCSNNQPQVRQQQSLSRCLLAPNKQHNTAHRGVSTF